jgi:acyl-CoA synthetase (AMP-forming)/AMP-acid ligase II
VSESEAQTIPALLHATASAYPETEAVVDGDRRITYEDLLADVRGVAGGLVAAGVEPGDRVAIWAPNSAEWIIAQLAIAYVGAVLVPLNTRFQGPEAEYIIKKSRARLLFTVREFLGRSYSDLLRSGELPDLRRSVFLDGAADFVADGAGSIDVADARAAAVEPADWLDLIYTSVIQRVCGPATETRSGRSATTPPIWASSTATATSWSIRSSTRSARRRGWWRP